MIYQPINFTAQKAAMTPAQIKSIEKQPLFDGARSSSSSESIKSEDFIKRCEKFLKITRSTWFAARFWRMVSYAISVFRARVTRTSGFSITSRSLLSARSYMAKYSPSVSLSGVSILAKMSLPPFLVNSEGGAA